ncbi:hypothetical protein B0T25DRAFT_574740 [Lasiosphaeria hispida]|uniref:Uncharacterized protein n=1 Tax=Lasiosphaeria hispida TaxID=260671 RepID=A0AAJ0M7T9_9PEZI|nr:hypothetical protein B0T25DRAFT_574740 [Lasiosphaeria hispida]
MTHTSESANPWVAERQRGRPKNTPAAIPVAMVLPQPHPNTLNPRTTRRSQATPKSASARAKRSKPNPVKKNAPRPLKESARRRLSSWELNLSEDEGISGPRSGIQIPQENEYTQEDQEDQGVQGVQAQEVQPVNKPRGHRLRAPKKNNTKAAITEPTEPRTRLMIKDTPRPRLLISQGSQELAATKKRQATDSLEPQVTKRITRSGQEVRATARALGLD